jgi:hypothetical protein
MNNSELNGCELIKGNELTPEQIALLPFKGAGDDSALGKENFLTCNSFYFKDGKPATVNGTYVYPVCTSFKNLPY